MTSSSPRLTMNLSPSKVRVMAFSCSTGTFSPPTSRDSIVHTPWKSLRSRSALTSPAAPRPAAASAKAQQRIVTRPPRDRAPFG